MEPRGLKRLNRFEKRIFQLAESNPDLIRLTQAGFSHRTKSNYRFPIYALEIGTRQAIKKNPVGLVAGVHGLEVIAVQVLLDFLEWAADPRSPDRMRELARGKVGLVALPILNPGGLVLRRRANPAGVDLMRNSGVDAEKAIPFFGGQQVSSLLPYFRGNTLQPESRVLFRFIDSYFGQVKNRILPVLDIHSGFGTIDRVWWPYAGKSAPCPDDALFRTLADHLKNRRGHRQYDFSPQNESYMMHGDLWDRLYDEFLAARQAKSARFLPMTLEIGTWTALKNNPRRLLDKKKIFNPTRDRKKQTTRAHREFLRDFLLLGGTKPDEWAGK